MAPKWVGGVAAVVAVLALAAQCGGTDTPVSGTAQIAPTTGPAPIQPALAAPAPTTAAGATTARPAPTTTRPAPTTTPGPQPAPRPQPRPEPRPQPQPAAEERDDDEDSAGGSVYYKNCDAVRAANAAPIRRGEPGYASHLDRDDDGTGCDRG
jgi:hypothetical protein